MDLNDCKTDRERDRETERDTVIIDTALVTNIHSLNSTSQPGPPPPYCRLLAFPNLTESAII